LLYKNEYLCGNDTDGEQADNTGDANGVVASTISIAMPDLEDSTASSNYH
jgi:hypothetical protein